MSILVRFLSAVAVLGTALFVSGCSASSSRAPRMELMQEFAVIESSTEKELTPEKLAELRKSVMKYLREQGMTESGFYYVKVTFPTTKADEPPQWAVVRIGVATERNHQLLAAYPGRDGFYPYDYYYHTSYHPGYAGFSRWGYYDPFDYNYSYYGGVPVPPRDPKPDHGHAPGKPHNPHKPGGNSDHPRVKPTGGWIQPRPAVDAPPRPGNFERGSRERGDRDRAPRYAPHRSGGEERSRPAPERSSPPERPYSPPSERSYSPPASVRVESSSSGRDERNPPQSTHQN